MPKAEDKQKEQLPMTRKQFIEAIGEAVGEDSRDWMRWHKKFLFRPMRLDGKWYWLRHIYWRWFMGYPGLAKAYMVDTPADPGWRYGVSEIHDNLKIDFAGRSEVIITYEK